MSTVSFRVWIQRLTVLFLAGSSLSVCALAADPLAVVSLRTDRAETREFAGDATPAPATFILHRTGSTDRGLTVFLAYEGSATSGSDYVALNRSVVIPAGNEELTLEVVPIDDTLVEGDETVVAKLIPPLTAIVPSYTIDPEQNEAKVVIHDNDQPAGQATVTITSPPDGAELPAGVDADVTAVAIDPSGYIPRLEFHLDGALLGVSQIAFLVAPKPGTPINHHVLWKSPLPGEHVLTASGVDANGAPVQSAPVHVSVTGVQPASATLKIASPMDGAVFPASSDVNVSAVAVDPSGYISHVDFYANEELIGVSDLKFFRAPDPGTPITHQITWSNAPAGKYEFTARAVDSGGNKIVSPSVHILVIEKKSSSFVTRKLPPSYTPGEEFEVTLTATPPLGTKAWAIQDSIPAGWSVIGATLDGVFDPATGAVKFGVFFDDKARTLTYRVGAPKGDSNSAIFKGTASADGQSSAIGGDSSVSPFDSTLPADVNSDKRITIDELTAYAAAWKVGSEWRIAPAAIPLTYVSRAAFIWRKGETYEYDGSAAAPMCWSPESKVIPVATASIGARSAQVDPATGNIKVTLQIQLPANGQAVAIEEKLPAGCAPFLVGDGGSFAPVDGTIRWGPIFGTVTPITVSYVLPPDMSDLTRIGGAVGVDGEVFTIDSNRPRIASLERGPDASVNLKIHGPDGQPYVLESSADLRDWKEDSSVFLPNGELDFTPQEKATEAERFYRLRSR